MIVSESDATEARERDLSFLQTTVIGRIELVADDLHDLYVGRPVKQETREEIWRALGHLRAQMREVSNWVGLGISGGRGQLGTGSDRDDDDEIGST